MSKFVKLEYSGILADNTLHRLSHWLLAVLDVLFEHNGHTVLVQQLFSMLT
jgi:hypothetical protein